MTEKIIFDMEGLTQTQLLRQICTRLDRHFPNEEDQRHATEAWEEAVAMIGVTADALQQAGLEELSARIRGLVE